MKLLKIIGILALVYVAIVVAFESWLGYAQPRSAESLVIATTDEQGERHDRVLSGLETDGRLYVSANHWPRAWFDRALENPEVEASVDGERGSYLAVRVSGEEHDRVDADDPLPLPFRILTGFPPRYFVRLDPREAG